MKAKAIVERLLEAVDPDAPDTNLERYVGDMYREAMEKARHDEVLRKFKRSVRSYIKWVHEDDMEQRQELNQDLVSIAAMTTFDQVLAVLAKWEDPEARFLYMVQQGYFA